MEKRHLPIKRAVLVMTELILDGQKLAWHKDRVDAWLNGERIAPITIDCALTRVTLLRQGR